MHSTRQNNDQQISYNRAALTANGVLTQVLTKTKDITMTESNLSVSDYRPHGLQYHRTRKTEQATELYTQINSH